MPGVAELENKHSMRYHLHSAVVRYSYRPKVCVTQSGQDIDEGNWKEYQHYTPRSLVSVTYSGTNLGVI